MSEIQEILNYVKERRKRGIDSLFEAGSIIAGYFCMFTPVEIIEACGAVPVRILPDNLYESEIRGTRFIRNDSCSFCKASLGYLDLERKFSCIISGTTCDQMRRIHEVIAHRTGIPVFLFSNPRTKGKESLLRLYSEEMKWIINELTRLTGWEFRKTLLADRVRAWNGLRSQLNGLQQKRRSGETLLTGTDMSTIAETAYYLGPEQFSDLSSTLQKLPVKEHTKTIKILLTGSICPSSDDAVQSILNQITGAEIVSETSCSGVIQSEGLIEEEGDIRENVFRYYHEKPVCPHRRPNDGMYEHLMKEIELWKPDGIIIRTLKFCHPWTFEVSEMKKRLNLPVLHLQSDYSRSDTGQMKTRIQAFIEMMSAADNG